MKVTIEIGPWLEDAARMHFVHESERGACSWCLIRDALLKEEAEIESVSALDRKIDAWLEWVVEAKGPDCRYDQAHNLDEKPCPMEGITTYVRGLHGITS